MSDPITLETIAELLRRLGFRAERIPWGDNGEALRSATGGVAFNVVPGNAGEGEALRDVTFFASFQLPATIPDLHGDWNRQRRFARLYQRDALTVMEMDTLLIGADTAAHVEAAVEIWNRLIHELVGTIRARLGQAHERLPSVPITEGA